VAVHDLKAGEREERDGQPGRDRFRRSRRCRSLGSTKERPARADAVDGPGNAAIARSPASRSAA
jgi:hypothetical protein